MTNCVLTSEQTGEKYTFKSSGSRPHIQPCSLCKNFAGGCEWSERFEPVEGWEAEPTVIGRDSYPIHSYRITYCPKYRKG